jgi:predicted amidohydrolase YtcJ
MHTLIAPHPDRYNSIRNSKTRIEVRCMQKTKLVTVVVAAVLISACQQTNTPETADLVLKNGYVYTVDEARSVAEAVAISGNTIVFVGTNADADAFIGEQTQVRDLAGAMVMPGLHDMHIHALGIVEPDMCDLDSEALSLEQMVPVLRTCLEKYEIEKGKWLIVLQWAFSRGNQPSENLPNIRAARRG